MSEFQYVCKINELTENKGKYFFIDEVDVALFKIDGNIYALNNVCPHHHVNCIADGIIENNFILCPNHFWRFDYKSGLKEGKLKGLDVYETKIENDEIFVKVFKKEMNW